MKRAPGRSRLEHGRVKRPYCVSDDEMNRESAASPDVFTVRGSWRRQAWVVGASSGFVVVGALMLLLPTPAKSVLPWSEAGQGLVGLLAILFGSVCLAVMVYVASRPILHVGPDGLTDYRRRIDIPFVDIMSVSIHSQQYRVVWLSWLIVVGSLLAGCGSSSDLGQQEPTYVRQLSITETTVRGLDDGWSVGVQWVSNERYVDAEGKERRGLVARISVWNDALGQSDTLHVYEGMVFPIGEQRFQVIKLKTNRSLSVAPGSSNGYIIIGQLAEDSEAVPGMGGMGLTAGTVERLFEDGSAHVYRQDGKETIDLYCHVAEGTWCYFVPQGQIEPYDGLYDPRIEDEARRITSDVAEQLTKELGVETIAHSRNNGVKVRCARPEDALSQVTCRVDRGGGWQESSVLP